MASIVAPAFAAEPWADGRLDVRDGLILWLDASTQVKAHAALSLPPVPPSGTIETWLDASGKNHHLIQRFGAVTAEARYGQRPRRDSL